MYIGEMFTIAFSFFICPIYGRTIIGSKFNLFVMTNTEGLEKNSSQIF